MWINVRDRGQRFSRPYPLTHRPSTPSRDRLGSIYLFVLRNPVSCPFANLLKGWCIGAIFYVNNPLSKF